MAKPFRMLLSWRLFLGVISLLCFFPRAEAKAPHRAAADIICRLQMAEGTTPSVDLVRLGHKYGLEFKDWAQGSPFVLYELSKGSLKNTLTRLRKDQLVVWAEADVAVSDIERGGLKGSIMPAVGERSALYAENQHLLEQIGWSSDLAFSPGRSVKIAVLDTGIFQRLWIFPGDFWTRIVGTINLVEIGVNYQPDDSIGYTYDSNGNGIVNEALGHGTTVMGVVDQIAPKAEIMIARVADSDGVATSWTLIHGLAWAGAAGAEVANVSLGTKADVPAIRHVLDWCEEKNLLVIAPAGNDATEASLLPANYPTVVCVSGVQADNTKAPFSNWSSVCDVSAPATGFMSWDWSGSWVSWSGTSFAAPMVAAAVADCLRRTNGPIPVQQLRQAITQSGSDLTQANPLYAGRLGRLLDVRRLNAALQSVGSPQP